MAYAETNDPTGDETMIFLHGNPTSSYLWRNIMAPLAGRGRLIAPDLIGMGDSDKLNNSGVDSYQFEEHADFLDKLLDCVVGTDTNDIILVIHDWGSALGFWWAYRNPERIKGIAYMEALVMPLKFEWLPQFEDFFTGFRTPGVGEELILQQNIFIEGVLPTSIIRNLTQEEMNVYRAPYLEPGEDRRPTLTWPREIPFDGSPARTHEIMANYSDWMNQTEIPKLLVQANPGAILVGVPLEFARGWKNQKEVSVAGIHFVQEDSPAEIAEAIGDWLDSDMFSSSVETVPPTSSPLSDPTMSPMVPPVSVPTISPSIPSGSSVASANQLWFVAAAWLFRMIW